MVCIAKNTVYTKGFVNDNGHIEVPGIFLEDGAEVDIAVTVIPGRFEIALLPSEMSEDTDEDIFEKYCRTHEDCDECPVKAECREDLER